MFQHDMPGARGNFKANYKAYSISMFPGPERADVEKGGKSTFKFKANIVSEL